MGISAGDQVFLGLVLGIIVIQLAMIIHWLKRIREVLLTIRWAVWKDRPELAEPPPEFHSPDPLHLPGSPFSTSMDLHNTK